MEKEEREVIYPLCAEGHELLALREQIRTLSAEMRQAVVETQEAGTNVLWADVTERWAQHLDALVKRAP